jgi:hypothetical protein
MVILQSSGLIDLNASGTRSTAKVYRENESGERRKTAAETAVLNA